MMAFSKALEILKDGGMVTRAGWHKGGAYLALQKPDEHSKMNQPYIYITIYADLDDIKREPWSDLSHTTQVNDGTSPYAVLKKSGSVNVTITGEHTGTAKVGTLNIYRIYGKCTATI